MDQKRVKLLIFASNPQFLGIFFFLATQAQPAYPPTHGPLPILSPRFEALGNHPQSKDYVAHPGGDAVCIFLHFPHFISHFPGRSLSVMFTRNNGFCGRLRRRRFCFRQTARGFFCLPRCVYTQNTQNFVENSKMDEKHKKGF